MKHRITEVVQVSPEWYYIDDSLINETVKYGHVSTIIMAEQVERTILLWTRTNRVSDC